MALKDAGVSRARLGDCEFEFPAEVELEAQSDRAEVIIDRIPAPTVNDVRQPVEQRPGYAKLLGEMPRFHKATE